MAQQKQPIAKPQTIVINNFGGRLTRILNGDLNSGFANFVSSYGYDFMSKPMNLTWLERQTDVSGVDGLILDGKVRFIGESAPTAYLLASTAKIYKIQINSSTNNSLHSVVGVFSILSGSPTFVKGGSIEFFGSDEKIYIGSDTQINRINFDGSGDATVGSAINYAANIYRPLKLFAGNLIFGNGNTIGAVGATGTVISSIVGVSSTTGNVYSSLVPPLPSSTRVKDLDISADNNYLIIAASEVDYENVSSGSTPNMLNTVPASSNIFYWNGSDPTVTAATNLSTNLLTSLQQYLQKNHLFASDSLGSGLFYDSQKVLSLPGNKSPTPNSTGVNGQFLYWSAPEKIVLGGITRLVHAIYYYGALDQENPPGLFRILRQTAGGGLLGNVIEMPFNKIVEIGYFDTNVAQSSVITAGIGTHYYSVRDVANDVITGSVLGLRRISVPASGTGTAQPGVYQTQTQLFSKRIGLAQIRVYTEPVVANNGFLLDLIGTDGTVVTNGTFTYTYGDPIDKDVRINFNPNCETLYGFGVRITNTGTVNMTIKKIEIDLSEEGK